MNGPLTATVVAGTALGLAVVLYATYAHLGTVVVALGGCVVLCSVGLMTAAIARYDGDERAEAVEPVDRS